MSFSYLTGHGNQGPNLVTYADGLQAVVYVSNFGVFCATRVHGTSKWRIVDLATVASNALQLPITDDTHKAPSIGVDWAGRLYVGANNFAEDQPRLIKSGVFGDISTWSNAEPDLAVQTAGSGAYLRFAHFSDGGLMLLRRLRKQLKADINEADNPGALVCEYRAAAASSWESKGVVCDGADSTQDALYIGQPYVDANDRVHVFGSWDRSIGNTLGTHGYGAELTIDHHSYFYSDDRGDTWHAIDGTTLTTPFNRTDASGVACRTGISFGENPDPDDGGTNNEYGLSCSVDGDGYPACTYMARTTANGFTAGTYTVRWNGSAWTATRLVSDLNSSGYTTNLVRWRDDLWAMGRDGTECKVVRVSNPSDAYTFGHGRCPTGWFPWNDPQRLRDHDRLEVLLPIGQQPRVYSIGGNVRVKP